MSQTGPVVASGLKDPPVRPPLKDQPCGGFSVFCLIRFMTWSVESKAAKRKIITDWFTPMNFPG